MAMIRREGPDDYQIGIWSVRREGRTWIAEAVTGDIHSELRFWSLSAAFRQLTGEDMCPNALPMRVSGGARNA